MPRSNLLDDDGSQSRDQPPEVSKRWRILIADDEIDVHDATALALRGVLIDGIPLDLLHAYSSTEALDLLTAHRDVAAALLDVVMETENAGLLLIERIREGLGNRAIRIILRTGQPGHAPQLETIRTYDINDYRTKSDLTRTGLFTCLSVALRSYRQIRELEEVRLHLEDQEQELTHSRAKLRALTAHQEKVREDERAHIARELHDEMGQYLTALRMEAGMLAMCCSESDTKVLGHLKAMRELIDHAIGETRRVVSHLRPTVLDLGLAPAAEWLVTDFQARTGIDCHLETPRESELELDPELATTLFRILQESLTNISRHARAQRVDIRIIQSGERLQMEICDDGRGFDPSVVREKGTFGLMGIRERVLIYGGSARFESQPGEGTRVRITLPYPAEKASP